MRRLIMLLTIAGCTAIPAAAQFSDSVSYMDPLAGGLFRNPYGWGYIAGTNEYGDRGKYQRFEVYEKPYLAAARIYFGAAIVTGTPDTVWVVVRDVDTTGPGPVIVSVPLTTDRLDTTGIGNLVEFSPRPQFQGEGFITDTLYIGIEWGESMDDTIGVFADSNGHGEQMQRVWEYIYYGDAWRMWPWYQSPDPDFEWALDSDLWIKAYLSTAPTHAGDPARQAPASFSLDQNFPNPFNPETRIRFSLPERAFVTLEVYDPLGRKVSTVLSGEKEAGTHAMTFDASGLASGVYLYRLTAGDFVATKKMSVVH